MFSVTLKLDAAATREYQVEQIVHQLKTITKQLKAGCSAGVLRNLNGNPVGHFMLEE